MNTHAARSTDEIEREIAATRRDMDRTLNELQGRFTPGQLLDQGLDYARNSGANEFVQNLGRSVKDNPMPVALVGIGLAWLMVTNRSNGRSTYRLDDSSGGTLRETIHDMKDRATQAQESISDTVNSAREHLSRTADGARQQVDRAREGYDWLMREHPLALGAIGVAIGALLAGAAPRTRIEDQVMGEKRDELMDRAKEAATEQLDPVKNALPDRDAA
jgi:ElaB/YqjD/DUF883 family membrane-anchored ribosome-binding protein